MSARLKSMLNQALAAIGYNLIKRGTLDALLTPQVDSSSRALEVNATALVRSRKLAPAPNRPPEICTALAPKFDPSKLTTPFARHIEEFQHNGITVIGTSAERAATWREREAFDRDVGNRHSAWDWAGNNIRSYSDDIRTGIPSSDLVEDLRALFGGDDFEAFFRGVLGCPANIANCRLVWSTPHPCKGLGPQEWHRDGTPPGVIRGVLYLNDVDSETGPFQYKDEFGKVSQVLGRTGDLLIFDAMRLLHRALPPASNVRAAIDLVFMPRLPGEAFRITIAGLNHWPADPFFFRIPVEHSNHGRQGGSVLR